MPKSAQKVKNQLEKVEFTPKSHVAKKKQPNYES